MWFTAVNLFLLLGLVVSQNETPEGGDTQTSKVVCFFGSWSLQRDGEDRFEISDIDPKLFTHLIYGFANLGDDNKIMPSAPTLEEDTGSSQGVYKQFNNLKLQNSQLTTMIAIGGWLDSSIKYSNMSSSPTSRKVFVDSVVEFLQKHGFDGLDMSWDYPAHRGGLPQDKENFVLLLKDLKAALKPKGYLLSTTVAGDVAIAKNAYDIPGIAENVDFINLMAYDFDFGNWENYTSHIAPLYGGLGQEGRQKTYNVNYTVRYWLDGGAPTDKLVLGMSIYMRLYTLKDASQYGVGDPTVDTPQNVQVTQVCKQTWNENFDDIQIAAYAYRDVQWLSLDNANTIWMKVKYAKNLSLAGVMASSIEMDDFRGVCYNRTYPFLTTLAHEMNLIP